MLFFLFLLCDFLLCFLLCHCLLPPYGTKTSLFNNGKTYLQESPTELSKRPINVVITFIVQIIKNPSRKFATRSFLCLVNSLSHHCAHALMLLLCRGYFNLFFGFIVGCNSKWLYLRNEFQLHYKWFLT